MLDEMDRALHDSLCVIKRMIESNSLVAGGGAVEVNTSLFLKKHSFSSDFARCNLLLCMGMELKSSLFFRCFLFFKIQ